MCGVWVALEDVHFDTGPLHYYPGSHKLPTYDCRQLGYAPTEKIDQTVYEALWEKLTEAHVLDKQIFEAKAGDALIWSANLLHEKRALTAEMAVRVSKVIGGTPESWLRMQEALDLWEEKHAGYVLRR
jgi:ectoine hydroxylase-related dioxygenase (phytanoyl-CoA dioxygenase family)